MQAFAEQYSTHQRQEETRWHACAVSPKWAWASTFTDATPPRPPSAPSPTPSATPASASSGCWARPPTTCSSTSPIAVPDPSGVDTAAVAKELPYGTVNVTAVKGGLEVPCRERKRLHHHRERRRDRQFRRRQDRLNNGNSFSANQAGRQSAHSTRRPGAPHDDARQQHLLEARAGRTARRRIRSGPRGADQRGGDDRQRLHQCPSLQQPRARHHRSAGRDPGRARRAGADRRRAGGVGCPDAGHADGGLQPRLARHRRRLLRDRPLRPSWRRHDRDFRLRQDRRRRADAAGAHQCLRARALSRHQHAGPRLVRGMGQQGQQHHDPRLRRGARRQRVRPPLRRGAIWKSSAT